MKTFDIQRTYEALHASYPGYRRLPVIGVTANFSDGNCLLADGYCTSVLRAGGTPLIIPPYEERDALLSTLDHIDGLLLTGGGDINPLFLGEEPLEQLHSINHRRDRQELLLARLASDRQIPVLGICRGIQVMNAGLSLKKCWQQANLLDDYFDSRLEFSFDEKLGYLTHCPTNLGTGMRASVLMHLPALEHTGYLQELVGVAHKLGLTIRGAYGEGTGGERSMYQISNQHSLGLSEGQILENLQAVVEQIAERERAERQLYCKDQLAFCDRVYRSLGVLQYARLLTHQEVMEHCGVLRLGCSLGLCPELTLETLSHIEAATGTGAILQTAPQATTYRQQDKLRADLVRQIISGSAARPAAPGGRA